MYVELVVQDIIIEYNIFFFLGGGLGYNNMCYFDRWSDRSDLTEMQREIQLEDWGIDTRNICPLGKKLMNHNLHDAYKVFKITKDPALIQWILDLRADKPFMSWFNDYSLRAWTEHATVKEPEWAKYFVTRIRDRCCHNNLLLTLFWRFFYYSDARYVYCNYLRHKHAERLWHKCLSTVREQSKTEIRQRQDRRLHGRDPKRRSVSVQAIPCHFSGGSFSQRRWHR